MGCVDRSEYRGGLLKAKSLELALEAQIKQRWNTVNMGSIAVVRAGGQVTSPAVIDYDAVMRHAEQAKDALQWMRLEITSKEWNIEPGEEHDYVVLAGSHIADALEDLTLAVKRIFAAADTMGLMIGAVEDSDELPF